MDPSQVNEILREGVFVALKIGAPLLILSMFVGILVAIFQAVTQIHEQTIAFALKLVVVIVICLVFGNKMMDILLDYAHQLFTLMTG